MKSVTGHQVPDLAAPELFTEMVIKSTPEFIATATASAIEADRLVWISELKPMRGKDTRCEVRLILRND